MIELILVYNGSFYKKVLLNDYLNTEEKKEIIHTSEPIDHSLKDHKT